MPAFLTSKKTRCPSCDHRNPVDAHRCDVCTRVLDNDEAPSQVVYDEMLFAEPVSTRHVPRRRTSSRVGMVVVLLITLLYVASVASTASWVPYPFHDYFVDKGSEWRTYADDPLYTAQLPGSPANATVVGPSGQFATASVWVDSHWDTVRDVNTISPGALRDARTNLHAGLVTASGGAIDDPRLVAPEILEALRPGASVSDAEISGVERSDGAEQFDVTADYSNWPDEAGSGTVMARFIQRDGSLFVMATYGRGGVEPDLQDSLVDGFEITAS